MVRLLTGWGRTAPTAAEVVEVRDDRSAEQAVRRGGPRGVLPRGLGRSYGDAAQNAGGTVLDLTHHDGTIAVDTTMGTVRVGAGVSLDELLRRVVPLGFFVPVTPGTRFVTVGGAIAADIHGKNHHRDGSLATHVRSITLATPVGTESLTAADKLFWATTGGMGLTGVVLDATFDLPRIESSLLRVDTDRTADLDEVLALMEDGDHRYRYSVAWLDCLATGPRLGRSILTRGDFASADDLPARHRPDPLEYRAAVRVEIPPIPAAGLVNGWTIRAFNEAWYRKAPRRRRDELQTIPRFFHPLDGVGEWNRLYGRRGFLQWQVVIPFGAEQTLRRTVERLSGARLGSPVTVLKRFGPGNQAPLSFPTAGWTLAIDFPVGPELGPVLDDLDTEVADAGGRVYLAKDSRVARRLIPAMYPRLDEWRQVRAAADPDGVLVSDLDRRLNLSGRWGGR
jgi:decaprenylphospho-beta-D-ribofuranose 2-oxidase